MYVGISYNTSRRDMADWCICTIHVCTGVCGEGAQGEGVFINQPYPTGGVIIDLIPIVRGVALDSPNSLLAVTIMA